jgi:hypothetical protein
LAERKNKGSAPKAENFDVLIYMNLQKRAISKIRVLFQYSPALLFLLPAFLIKSVQR